MKRRTFLGFVAAGPLAAKQAADKVAMKYMGMQPGLSGAGDPAANVVGVESDEASAVWQWMQKHGIPDWRLEEIKNESRRVLYLDHDIACVKSSSLAAKIYHQQERNLARMIDEETAGRRRNRERSSFLKTLGIRWWAW